MNLPSSWSTEIAGRLVTVPRGGATGATTGRSVSADAYAPSLARLRGRPVPVACVGEHRTAPRRDPRELREPGQAAGGGPSAARIPVMVSDWTSARSVTQQTWHGRDRASR